MSSHEKDAPAQTAIVVDDAALAEAYELFRADEVERLRTTNRTTVRLRGYELRVEDAEDVLSAVAVEVVLAARAGKISARLDETSAEAAHRRMHMPLRRRVIDAFRARRGREQIEIVADVAGDAGPVVPESDLAFVDAVAVLRTLPADHAALLYESIVLGTPDADLASREGVTPPAIRQRRRRILAAIHARLDGDGRAAVAGEAA